MATQVQESASPKDFRVKERDEFRTLNDRLAAYIEAVKNLKGQNLTLETEITVLQSEISTAAEKVREVYEEELTATQALLEETEEEKKKQLDLADTFGNENEELKRRVVELKSTLEELQKRLTAVTMRYNQVEGQYNSVVHECSTWTKNNEEVQREIDEIKCLLEKLQKDLENETAEKERLRVRVATLKREISTLEEEHTKEVAIALSIEEETDYPTTYESGLDETIAELRLQNERECAQYKMELEYRYKDKLERLEERAAHNAETIATLTADLRQQVELRNTGSKEMQKLRDVVDRFERQIKDKEVEIGRAKQERSESVTLLLSQLRTLRADYEENLKSYKDLFALKIDLDQELAAYKAMLKGEEGRLLMVPSPGKHPRPEDDVAPEPQRVRYNSASGNIQIVEVDPAGKFIQIRNMSDKPEHLGGFKLVHIVSDTSEKSTFTFHMRSRLKGGVTTTVWSKLSREEHQPPTDIVSKQIDMWGVGKETTTKLFTSKGEVIATYVQRTEEDASV